MGVTHRALLTLALAAATAVPVGVASARPAGPAGPVSTIATTSTPASALRPMPLCGSVGTGAPRPAGALRVASFNVLHGLTDDGDRTLEARLRIQVAELAASRVDIVGLQEVGESTNHGRVIARLAAGLAAATHVRWHWCWFRTEPHAPGVPDSRPGGGDALSDQFAAHYNSHEQRWYEGAAVLSRWPITASAAHRLPGESPNRLTGDCRPPFADPTCLPDLILEPRAAVWTRVATPYGAIGVTSAHTSGNVKQHRDLTRWAANRSAGLTDAFLVCDCNSTPTSAAQRMVRAAGWVDTARRLHTDGPTADQQLDAAQPTVTTRIDYVFQRSASTLRLLRNTRFMDVPVVSAVDRSGLLWPSDHWGVITSVGRG